MLLEDFALSSLSLLSKINKWKIDANKCAQALKKDGKVFWGCISYLMKCIYKNARNILKVNRLVLIGMENYIK